MEFTKVFVPIFSGTEAIFTNAKHDVSVSLGAPLEDLVVSCVYGKQVGVFTFIIRLIILTNPWMQGLSYSFEVGRYKIKHLIF